MLTLLSSLFFTSVSGVYPRASRTSSFLTLPMPGTAHFSLLSPGGPVISSQATVSSTALLATFSLTSPPPSLSGSLPGLESSPDTSPFLIDVPLVVIPTTQDSGSEASPSVETPHSRHTSSYARSFVAIPPIYARISPSTGAASSSTSTYPTTSIPNQALLYLQSQAFRGLGSELAPTNVPPSQSVISAIAAFSTQSSPVPSVMTIGTDKLISSSTAPASTALISSSTASSLQSRPSVASTASSYGYVTGVRLAHPTPIIAQAVNDSHYDDASATIAPGFAVQLFGQRSTSFTVTTNGVCVLLKRRLGWIADKLSQLFVVGAAALADNAGSTQLYAPGLPPGTACVFWKDLVAGITAQQGIYYQLDDYGSNVQLSVEYILTDYIDEGVTGTDIYHVILQYDSDAVGLMEQYYFSGGDSGALGTIGIQGFDASHYMQSVTWNYNTPNSVTPGLKLNFVTNLNDEPNGTVAQRSFVVDCFPPGTWPIGICRS